jgi:hypothetical protein
MHSTPITESEELCILYISEESVELCIKCGIVYSAVHHDEVSVELRILFPSEASTKLYSTL